MSGQQELYAIKQELRSIINELESIASGVGHDFEGIGNRGCASAIHEVADHYRSVTDKLSRIDTTKIKEGFPGSSQCTT
ncbi:hypothetical protein [Ectobacillus ponti]|uniref:Uncharacterized protein n=1 Tax=Ectobacillus ponti TaxID=2961894 RepID=A0AA41X5X5_9BACI|nr:hypothetical protein [Ectobacillus ponti]MCP8969377.1 hypothetical protein [Ectobacillus ponti]